jgi:hypothetical protein
LNYGASVAVRATNNVSGTTAIGTSDAFLASNYTYSASGGLTGVQGVVSATHLETDFPNKTALLRGGFFGATITNPIPPGAQGVGPYLISGVTGQLDGAISNYPTNGVVAAVVGNDNIGGTQSYAGYFNGKGYFSGAVNVTGNALVQANLQVGGTNTAIASFASNHQNGRGGYLEGGQVGVLGVGGAHFASGAAPQETFGVWGIGAAAANTSVGVHGDANGAMFGKGVWGSAIGANVNYGVYGDLPGGPNTGFAGYFNGDVYTSTQYLASDDALKQNIRQAPDAMKRLVQLRPVAYSFIQQSGNDLNLASGEREGFLASNIKVVFPQFVKRVVQPPHVNDRGEAVGAALEFDAVSYVSFVPILVKGLQEQQAVIERLEARIVELERKSKQ